MIGSGLKKLAKQYEMTLASGVAYGNLKGYATTLSEGAGWKRIDISTQFVEAGQQEQFMAAVQNVDVGKEYRVQRLGVNPRCLSIIFQDNPGTMKKIEAFIEWFYPLLQAYGAAGVDTCMECGTTVTDGTWYLINGVAHHLHGTCADRICGQIQQETQQQKEEATGSYFTGFLGALIGAVLGAIVWAIVLYLGYMASIVGLLIGWLAEKGYTLLKGKKGKGKVAILIVVIIFAVLLGSLIPDVAVLAEMINTGELQGFAYGDIPLMILTVMAEDSEYLGGTLSNMGLGLLFAALGAFALLRKTSQEVSGTTVKKLK